MLSGDGYGVSFCPGFFRPLVQGLTVPAGIGKTFIVLLPGELILPLAPVSNGVNGGIRISVSAAVVARGGRYVIALYAGDVPGAGARNATDGNREDCLVRIGRISRTP